MPLIATFFVGVYFRFVHATDCYIFVGVYFLSL